MAEIQSTCIACGFVRRVPMVYCARCGYTMEWGAIQCQTSELPSETRS